MSEGRPFPRPWALGFGFGFGFGLGLGLGFGFGFGLGLGAHRAQRRERGCIPGGVIDALDALRAAAQVAEGAW